MTGGKKDSSHSEPAILQKPADSEVESRFNDLLDRYGSLLRNAIVRVCPKHLGVQFSDIEQEARIRLWRALESEREIQNPGSYIYRVAVSATLTAIQKVKARREEQLDLTGESSPGPDRFESPATDPRESPEAVAAGNELIEKIEQALDGLPENRRLATRLYLKGMTTDETAELMGWSEPKARNLTYRGLKDLRESLRALGIEWEK